MKDITNKISENLQLNEARKGDTAVKPSETNKESSSFALSEDDLDKILFSLAFTAGWSSNVDSYEMKEYKKLWDELNKAAKKSFDEERFVNDWSDYEMAHTGSFKRLR